MGKHTKLFFATDVHGSNLTFRKFLASGKFYDADVAILAGDITGKMIIPVIELPDGKYEADYLGKKLTGKSAEELEVMKKRINDSGFYAYVGTQDEIEKITSDPKKKDKLFLELQIERLKEWYTLAEERLKDRKTRYFMSPGNDDPWVIDEIIKEIDASAIIDPEGKVVYIDDIHEMVTCGLGNPTPWKTPREVSEEELASKIEEIAVNVKDMENCIFNLHVPPIGSGLDSAPLLDEKLTIQRLPGGGAKMSAVGSKAVRDAIEKYKPLMGIHGHIHESRAASHIGNTFIVNPGSEYGEGILRGAIILLEDKKVKEYYFTSG